MREREEFLLGTGSDIAHGNGDVNGVAGMAGMAGVAGQRSSFEDMNRSMSASSDDDKQSSSPVHAAASQNRQEYYGRHHEDARLPPQMIVGDQHGRPIRELGAVFESERCYSINTRKLAKRPLDRPLKRPDKEGGVNDSDDACNRNKEVSREQELEKEEQMVTMRGSNQNIDAHVRALPKHGSSRSHRSSRGRGRGNAVPRLDRTLLRDGVTRSVRATSTVSKQRDTAGSFLYPLLESSDPVHRVPTQKLASTNFTPRGLTKQNQSGYCFCCHVTYTSLDDHVASYQHEMFHANDNNFVELEHFLASVYRGKRTRSHERSPVTNTAATAAAATAATAATAAASDVDVLIRKRTPGTQTKKRTARRNETVTKNIHSVSIDTTTAQSFTGDSSRGNNRSAAAKRCSPSCSSKTTVVGGKKRRGGRPLVARLSKRQRSRPVLYNPNCVTTMTFFDPTTNGLKEEGFADASEQLKVWNAVKSSSKV